MVLKRQQYSLPDFIKEALKDARLLEKFRSLPPSHQREYLGWIEEAKRPETRASRIEKLITKLS